MMGASAGTKEAGRRSRRHIGEIGMMKHLGIKGLLAAAVAMAFALPAMAADATDPAATRFDVSGLTAGGSYDRFIVSYRDGSTQAMQRGAAVQSVGAAIDRAGLNKAVRTLSGASLQAVAASYQRKLAVGADLIRTSRKLDRAEAAALIAQIAADPAVAYVEPDLMMRAVRDIPASGLLAPDTVTPNDQYYAKYQWHYQTPDGTADGFGNPNWGGANVNNAWDLADGAGIVIAVLDTGITQHPDIDTSLGDAGYDFIIDHTTSGRATDGRVPGGWDLGDWTTTEPWLSQCTDANNPPSDSSWHGTHVSSTSGAELTNNGIGMAGIAHGAKVLPLRVLGHCGGRTSDIADAIVWAAGGAVDGVPANLNPAQVINLSLGGGGACTASSTSGQAVAKARSLGAAVVVSAGNSNKDAANYSPASCPGAIAVASTGVTSKRAYYSNYGSVVKIAAPGGGVYANDAISGAQASDGFVWQALNGGKTVPEANYKYGGMAGTSQAAPHITGVVALMQGARKAAGLALLSPDEVLDILQSTAMTPKVAPSASQPIGAGIVDAYAAVSKAVAGGEQPPVQAIALANGVMLSGQAGKSGSSTVYKLVVPAGATGLSLRTLGGSGDVSLYVKRDAVPTTTSYDFKSARPGNNEAVVITRPVAGTYYLTVVGEVAYSGVTVLGNFIAPR